eukprot:8512007-Pyramimonas_sp.AAC.1
MGHEWGNCWLPEESWFMNSPLRHSGRSKAAATESEKRQARGAESGSCEQAPPVRCRRPQPDETI